MSAAASAPSGAFALPRPLIVATGLTLAFAAGALISMRAPLGVAFALGVVYAPIALANLPIGILVWIALAQVSRLEFVWIGPNVATALIIVAGIGTIGVRRHLPTVWQGSARALPAAAGLLLAWLSLSALWARDVGAVGGLIWEWYVAAAVFVVVAVGLRTQRDVQLVLLGFVGGAVLSVAIGLAADGLSGSPSAYDTATSTEGRLQGGAGDPNYLAAALVPGLVFAIALFQTLHDPVVRLGLAVSLLIMTLGLFATQSRGGFIAFGVAIVAALVVMRGRRGPLLAGLLVVLTFGGAYLAANPVALERLTTTDQGGNGRSDLWTVASRIGTDRPVAGVGLNNFHDYARDYTRDVGTLRFVRIIAERPHVVHNTYLQLWAETGVIGLGLFLALAGLVLRTLRGAARRFAAARDRDGLILADAVFVSVLAGLAASFFLSNGPDWRMWFMWGLAPALGLLAARSLRHA